jgi:1-acyl-sn-glycerol-3-phosphate acyltransferase
MKDSTYFFWTRILYYLMWRGETIGLENLPRNKPAVLISNHLDARGPIGISFSFPVRTYPWVDGNVFDPELAPDHLRKYFSEKVLHLKPPLSIWLANLLSDITVPLFQSIELIPVYHKDHQRTQKTFDRSLDRLRKNGLVVIFPEKEELGTDPRTNISGFKHSYVRLGEMLFLQDGTILDFIPITVHPTRTIVIGKPVPYDPGNSPEEERRRINEILQQVITETYLQQEPEKEAQAETAAAAD